ncbi:MAG: DUF116 domain-containing protein [Endomicrobium sp.]|nr:DUF116 domain-containing protein [Endomicrobium sp.]
MGLCKIARKSKEQVYQTFTNKQNKFLAKKFSAVPFDDRIVFAPHCMRNTAVCSAVEESSYYICVGCGGCGISNIRNFVKELNYKALYVVKGARAIDKIVKEQKPKAIVGIACFFEGVQAGKMLKGSGMAAQFIPLTKDGCAATSTDLTKVEKILKQ